MKLYVPCESCQEHGEPPCGRVASPAELKAAARPHADMEAAIEGLQRYYGSVLAEYLEMTEGITPAETVRAILDAALGADVVAASKAEREERG